MPKYPQTKLKVLKYNSPSGTININKWVPPFQKVKKGFGFVGILATDTETGKLQCHICGGWYDLLTTHIFAKHRLTSKEYCEDFGLFRSTALKCMRVRKIQSEVMFEMRRGHYKHRMKFQKGNKWAGNRKGQVKPIEEQNRYGICDLQVIDKIKSLQEELGGKTPPLTRVIDRFGGAFSTLIHNRYGGYIRLIKSLGMIPVTSSFTPKFSKKYFINLGVKAVRHGKKLIGHKILNQSEERNIYTYFPSQKVWKKAVVRELNKT